MSATNNLLLLLLWFLWLATALQFALALHGSLVERREGMRISRFRLLTVSGVFVLTTALALAASLVREPTQPAPTPVSTATPQPSPSVPDDPKTKELRQQIEKAQAEVTALDKQKKDAEQRLADLQKQLPTAAPQVPATPTAVPTPTPPLIPRAAAILGATIAVAFLLLVGFVALLAGGNMQTLFPAGWLAGRRGGPERLDMQRELNWLTAAVWRKDYGGGLEIAERMEMKQLDHFDQLDYLYLRAYCSIQLLAGKDAPERAERRHELRAAAIKDLESVVEELPNRGEAVYLLALAYGLADQNAEALATFEQAQKILTRYELPFDHNESVCLLRLAEISLSKGNTEQAENYFGRVTSLGKLAGSVVESRVRIGLINLRDAVNRKDKGAATAGIRKLEGLKELKPEQRAQIEVISAAFSARIALREGDVAQALAQATSFLQRHLPKDLPPPTEEAAEEMLGSLILENELPFPREVFRGFLFIQAVALCRLETRTRTPLSEAQVAKLSEPLLRGLQFEPRQRELLGALGGLYYWFRKDRRQKALDWLEAAAIMGVSGRIVGRILERDRLIEMERRESLDWFRSASARFLRDPSLAGEVRRALVEELGRFQEFEPLLISLEQRPELEEEEPTIEVMKERARYLSQLVAHMAQQGQSERQSRLAQIRADYTKCLASLEQTTESMATLERRVIEELGELLAI